MKILHTADWHIGLTIDNIDLGKGESTRIDEARKVLSEMLDQIPNVDIMTIAGDLFSYSFPSPYLVAVVKEFLQKCTALNPKIQIIIIVGNHDLSSINMRHSLESLKEDNIPNIHVYDQCESIKIKDINFIALPFMGKYVGLEDIVPLVNKNISAAHRNFLIWHGSYKGVVAGGESFLMRDAWNIDSAIEGIDYYLSGHIHKHQIIDNKVLYPGSTFQCDAGERDDEKGYAILDTDTMVASFIPFKNYLKYKVFEFDHCPTKDETKNLEIDKTDIVTLKLQIKKDQMSINIDEIKHALLEKSPNIRPFNIQYDNDVQVRDSTITETLSPMEALKQRIKTDKPKYAKEITQIAEKIFAIVMQGSAK